MRPGSAPTNPTSGGAVSAPPRVPGSPVVGQPTSGPRPPAGPLAPGRMGPGVPGPVSPPPPYRMPGPIAQPPRPVERPYGGYGAPGGYGGPPPMPQPAAERNGNGLITVVVVIGLLALLACAGLIGYLVRQGS